MRKQDREHTLPIRDGDDGRLGALSSHPTVSQAISGA
jgi:hypothetical protein